MLTSCCGCSSASTRLMPHGKVGRRRADPELLAHDDVEPFGVQHAGDLVDRVRVDGWNDGLGRDVREERDLAPVALRHRTIGAAQHDVRLDADFAQLLHRVLRGLRLHLARGRDVRYERQVDVADVVAAERDAELADGFQERQRFNVAHGSADLHQRDLGIVRAGHDPALDLVRDVRDDLDRAPEVVAAALLADHRFVDLPRREVVALAHPDVGEALVVPEVEVGLRAVVGHEHFAVLERRHRAGIDVDVRIELEMGDADAAGSEDGGERSGSDALSQRGNDTTGHEDEFRHNSIVPEITILADVGALAKVAPGRQLTMCLIRSGPARRTSARASLRGRAVAGRRRSRAWWPSRKREGASTS